jgi:hypothetical protein
LRSSRSERLTVSTGTAKPTPSPPPDWDLIWALIPSTRPCASSSGPPELPGLIAASVWIALPMANRVSDWMLRSTAETTPIDSDCFSPNGLPMAATGWPTLIAAEWPSVSGVSDRPFGSTFSSATSALGSVPTIFAGTRLPSENSMNTWSARSESFDSAVTTWALVAM